jgi:hypothetical protein
LRQEPHPPKKFWSNKADLANWADNTGNARHGFLQKQGEAGKLVLRAIMRDDGKNKFIPHVLLGLPVRHELSVLALVKGKERYVFVYDDESREKLIDSIRHQAADPEVTLSWFDAAVLTERARQQVKSVPAAEPLAVPN